MSADIDIYLEAADPEAIRFDGLDDAVVGTDNHGWLVYDYDRMIECLMVYSEMSLDETIEWIDYNVLGVMGGDRFTVLYSNEGEE
jgi:hypothetical protein